MSDICKRKDVMVIQGDILEVYFELNGIAPAVVKSAYFESNMTQLYVECPYSSIYDGYCLRLTSDITQSLTPTIGSYDLTVEFIDGNKITVIHEGMFAVLKKRNALCEEG